jgi:hypothetical protein
MPGLIYSSPMYVSGHSDAHAELRSALLRLEQAVARHEALLADTRHEPADASLQVLRNSIAMMRQEADRLRWVLAET